MRPVPASTPHQLLVPTVADGAPRRRSSSPETGRLWVRRCARCDGDDLNTAVGSEALIGDGPWRCRRCGARRWVAARLVLPADPSGRCPHLDAARDREER